jgi:ABC-2 type transport system permease protein
MTLGRQLLLLGKWIRTRLLIYLRTPRAAFFTFIFPLILLLLLNSVNSGQDIEVSTGQKVSFAAYFTPSIAIFALVTGCYTGTIFAVSTARDRGILKRVAGTPLPAPVFLGAWAGATIITGFCSVAFLVIVGLIFFDVSIDPGLILAAVVTVLVGGLCLSSLGLAVVTFVRKAESAPAVSNLTMFPILFLSGVFFPIGTAPQWIQTVADIFPVAHLVDSFTSCFDPATTGTGFTSDLWNPLVWAAVGLFVATRRFRVEMTAAGGDRRRTAPA